MTAEIVTAVVDGIVVPLAIVLWIMMIIGRGSRCGRRGSDGKM
jgi:hypothetical protein